MAKQLVKVRVSGLRELDAALNELDLDIRKRAARKAAKDALEPVKQQIERNAPVDTGGLRASVRWSSTTAQGRLKKLGKNAFMVTSINVGFPTRNNVRGGYQALQVEFGANGKAARPFIRPAIQGKEKAVFMRFRRTLRESINKFAMTQSRRNKRKLK